MLEATHHYNFLIVGKLQTQTSRCIVVIEEVDNKQNKS